MHCSEFLAAEGHLYIAITYTCSTACKLQPYCCSHVESCSEATALNCVNRKRLLVPLTVSCVERDVGAGKAESMAAAMAGEA